MQKLRRSFVSIVALAKRELAAALALLVIAGCSLLFVELAEDVYEGEAHDIDRAIMLALRNPTDLSVPRGPAWVHHAMVDITSLGSTTCLALFTLFTAGLLLFLRKRLESLLVLVAVAGAALFMSGLKNFFDRSRPDVVPHLVEVFNQSFPSGHAMVSAATYLTLGTLSAHASERHVAAYILAAAATLTLLIGCSRVYLGVHWPTDVLAGWCAGAMWAMGCWLITVWLQRRAPR